MYEAYICGPEGRNEETVEILKKYQNKGIFFRGRAGACRSGSVSLYSYGAFIETRLRQCGGSRTPHMAKAGDSFQLVWLLLQMDGGEKNLPSEGIFMMEEQFERGVYKSLFCIWRRGSGISEDITLFSQAQSLLDPCILFCGKKRGLLKQEERWLCVWLIFVRI